jgi:4-hydroxyphenylpyruvate dioxygenase
MDPLYWSRHFRNMPGEGDLPVADFVRAVFATGYRGPLSLEVFNDQFRGGSAKAIAVDGHRSLINLVDQVARADPALGIPKPTMPPRVQVKGIEFVEFATDADGAALLVKHLGAMGFAPAARHKNKDVTLFRQGEINLVLNTEAEGLAHSVFVTHGTSAYAIGLKVEDAAATVARARALGAQLFEQTVAEGELLMPAIRGLGGGVIYFVDEKSELARVWEVEFSPLPSAPHSRGAGLARIDHLAQTMNYEEIRYAQKPDRGRARSGRRCPQPGPRKRLWQPASYPERRREPAHRRRAVHQRNLRLKRPAHRVRDRGHIHHGPDDARPWFRALAYPRELLW